MHIFFDARTITTSTWGLSIYARALFEVFVTLLDEGERITILVRDVAVIPPECLHDRVAYRQMVHPALSFKGWGELKRLTEAEKPDIYWSPDATIPAFGISSHLLLSLHDLGFFTNRNLLSLKEKIIWKLIRIPQIGFFDRIICTSNVLRKACAEYLGGRVESNCSVIYNGVQEVFRPYSAVETEKVREKYRLPQKFFLFVGQDCPYKNLETLLYALADSEDNTTVPLVVAGRDSDTPGRRKMVRDLGLRDMIHFIGNVDEDDLPSLYSAAYAVLHPSILEGFSQTIIQAQACGTPVICAALPENKEIFENSVVLVHPTDRVEWRTALITMVLSSVFRERLREQGLAHAAGFTWRKTARESLELCRSLARRNG